MKETRGDDLLGSFICQFSKAFVGGEAECGEDGGEEGEVRRYWWP
jgi:hypothetical protein